MIGRRAFHVAGSMERGYSSFVETVRREGWGLGRTGIGAEEVEAETRALDIVGGKKAKGRREGEREE